MRYKEPIIIAEIGANHNGDMALARKMIKAARECGCDYVKFQSWTPDSLISREEYQRNQELRDMVEKYYLRPEQHRELSDYCKKNKIGFSSSAFSPEEIDLLKSLKVDFIKIASMDITNLELLKYAGRAKLPIMLSTGMASMAEIKKAVTIIEKEGNKKLTLMHCISIYPPQDEDINLNNIPMLKKEFNYPVGFSDHTLGDTAALAAVALGATVIEKHFTLDKNLPGWDHQISADPGEMKLIASGAKRIAGLLGSDKRSIGRDEEAQKLKFRRSIVAARDLKKETSIKLKDLSFKRPGNGIPPDKLDSVMGKKLKRAIKADNLIEMKDLI